MIGTIGKGLRFAGTALKGNMGRGELAARLLPDAAFGVLAGAMTPGDLGDKLIAGSGQAIGGGLGGLALSRAGSKLPIGQAGSFVLDMAGSFGGDYAGMYGADALMRGKDLVSGGEGQTPWEKMGAQQQEQMRQEMQEQILWQYGLVPGSREQFARDGFMVDNGLG